MYRSILYVTVKTELKSVNFWRNIRTKISRLLFCGPRCIFLFAIELNRQQKHSVHCRTSERLYLRLINRQIDANAPANDKILSRFELPFYRPGRRCLSGSFFRRVVFCRKYAKHVRKSLPEGDWRPVLRTCLATWAWKHLRTSTRAAFSQRV